MKVQRWVWFIALAMMAVVVGVIVYGYMTRPGWVGVSGKKFWNYLELLIVPAVLAIGVYWLNLMQERERQAQEAYREREREVEAEQRQREREATEEARRERELEVENQRAQDEALQAYLSHMSQLLTDKDRPLLSARPNDERSVLARARTLTLLAGLKGDNKWSVLMFLHESGLIRIKAKLGPVVRLKWANLQDAKLGEMVLEGASLRETKLRRAHLNKANLRQSSLMKAYLSEANLNGADLGSAYLSEANLNGADLSEANLSVADLSYAKLSGTDLSRATLWNANLRGADLSYARGVTDTQLAEAGSLEGATMPDGQTLKGDRTPDGPTFEEWLKSKGRGEDGEDSGPS